MFFHNFKYALIGIIKEKTSLFWACIFPFLLGTMFVVAFSNIYDSEIYSEIPAAVVVKEKSEDSVRFQEVVSSLETSDGKQLFKIQELSETDAKKQLKDEKIQGYFIVDDGIRLMLRSNGVNETILNSFLEQYRQQEKMIADVTAENPQNIQVLVQALSENMSFCEVEATSKGNMDSMVQYYYALFAMSCLFGSFLSITRTMKLQANASAIGARRGVAPIKKVTVVFSEILACLVLECAIECGVFAYLTCIWNVDLGDKTLYVFPVLFVGSAFGVSLGVLLGSIGRFKDSVRMGLNTCICMALSFCSGLMVHLVKQLIEDTVPFFNRVNPAVLITDALYSLNVYETMDRYWMNMGILSGLTVLLCVASILLTRRTRYASL